MYQETVERLQNHPQSCQVQNVASLLTEALISSFVDKEGSNGAGQKHQIKPYGPVAHVVDIHLDPVSEESVVAAGNLPRSGYTWWYAQNLLARLPDLSGLAGQVGARADQAHLPAQDVPKLRQLIQAGPAQEPADVRNTGIDA